MLKVYINQQLTLFYNCGGELGMNTGSAWFIYIIETKCGKLYTGITTDVDRRFEEHTAVYHRRGNKGAKFFRGHWPDKVVYSEACLSRSEASKREYQIKTMSKRDKINLFKQAI